MTLSEGHATRRVGLWVGAGRGETHHKAGGRKPDLVQQSMASLKSCVCVFFSGGSVVLVGGNLAEGFPSARSEGRRSCDVLICMFLFGMKSSMRNKPSHMPPQALKPFSSTMRQTVREGALLFIYCTVDASNRSAKGALLFVFALEGWRQVTPSDSTIRCLPGHTRRRRPVGFDSGLVGGGRKGVVIGVGVVGSWLSLLVETHPALLSKLKSADTACM